jgi:hypothetical protein
LANDRHKLAGPHLHIEVVKAEQASALAVVNFLFSFIGSQQVLHLGCTVGVESVVFFSVVAVIATLPFVLAVDYAYRTVREMIVLIYNAMDLLQAEEVIESFERRFGLDPIADQIRELETLISDGDLVRMMAMVECTRMVTHVSDAKMDSAGKIWLALSTFPMSTYTENVLTDMSVDSDSL